MLLNFQFWISTYIWNLDSEFTFKIALIRRLLKKYNCKTYSWKVSLIRCGVCISFFPQNGWSILIFRASSVWCGGKKLWRGLYLHMDCIYTCRVLARYHSTFSPQASPGFRHMHMYFLVSKFLHHLMKFLHLMWGLWLFLSHVFFFSLSICWHKALCQNSISAIRNGSLDPGFCKWTADIHPLGV